jgi:penicillin-insensitive murein endopeptidase
MRLSRNRTWGHPDLIALVEKLALDAKTLDGWPGLLVGDLSQPRGGPMLSGHASHQVGLDADIWLTPMPDGRLTEREREDLSATSMLAEDMVSVDPKVFTDAHVRVLQRAASYPSVERIFVHPAIKKALCEATAKDAKRGWLHKVRAYWGHNDHFHVRILCPKGSSNCQAQPPLPSDDGCGKELTNWLALVKPKPPAPKPTRPAVPKAPKPPITLDQLPGECRAVLASGPEGISIPEPAVAAATAPAAKAAAPAKSVAPTH